MVPVSVTVAVVWYVILYSLIDVQKNCGETWCLFLKARF